MFDKQNNIIYSVSDLQRYNSGLMTEAEMHAIEKAALEDPFLADALEGYQHTTTAGADIQELQNRLSGQQSKRVVPLFTENALWWKVAAMLLILTGALYFSILFNQKADGNLLTSKESLAANKTIEKNLAKENLKSLSNGFPDETSITSVPGKAANYDSLQQPLPGKELAVLDKPTQADATQSSGEINSVIKSEQNDFDVNQNHEPVTLDKGLAANRQKNPLYSFTGKITDSAGRPVPFVTVKDQRSNNATTSDESGRFSILSNDSILAATVAGTGYTAKEKKLLSNADETIVLAASTQNLAEVVVQDNSRAGKKLTATSPSKVSAEIMSSTSLPASHDLIAEMASFDKYVADSIKRPQQNGLPYKGPVKLSFATDKNGRPQNIRTENSLCIPCDEEAIRLLRSGPKWKRTNKRISVTVNF